MLRIKKAVPCNSSIYDNGYNRMYSDNLYKVNIIEEKEKYRIELIAPGYLKENFTIKVEDDVLNISVEKINKNEEQYFLRKEFGLQSFNRSFGLPDSIDQEKINAIYKDGILNIELPLKDDARPMPAKVIKVV